MNYNIFSKFKILFFFIFFLQYSVLFSQTHIPADPYYTLTYEKKQFNGDLPLQANMFRPLFFKTDSSLLSLKFKNEFYFNDNSPNQENMDLRYISKGIGQFTSFQFSFSNNFISFIAEPYLLNTNYFDVNNVKRKTNFSVLNDQELGPNQKPSNKGLRNLLAFIHYKGIGLGVHNGNKWWGPGIHSSLQMTNNTQAFNSQILGTIKEIRFGKFGLYSLYSFSQINNNSGHFAKYFTSLNTRISWYGPILLTFGLSRNYLTGGITNNEYKWKKSDARKIIFEGIFTSNLIDAEYTVGGHDLWDQTISGYVSIILPKRNLKLYAEFGFNDNRMYLADFLSQPDHSMATIFGIRDFGFRNNKNWIWGFEWTNLMITYSSRHRLTGPGTWYHRGLYDYSSYHGRRWAAHSGSDSDDWYIYFGYLSDKIMIIPAFNYERHGIVTYRPAEVKFEFRLDSRYKYENIWFGIYFEKQYEAFLGFPDYYYVNNKGNPIDSDKGRLANSRKTNTIIFSISRYINF